LLLTCSDFKFSVRGSLELSGTPIHIAEADALCDLSLMACFADINVSQASVATYARCGGIFHIRSTANLPRNLPVKKMLNWLRFDGIMVMSLWPRFFGPPCTFKNALVPHAYGTVSVAIRCAQWSAYSATSLDSHRYWLVLMKC